MLYRKEVRRILSTTMMLLSVGGLIACSQAPQQGTIAIEADGADGIIGGRGIKTTDAFRSNITALYNAAEGSLCTASIYSDTILVTAAHCVEGADPKMLKVVFGDDLSQRAGLVIRTADAYKQSPVWAARQGQKTNTGDIAIVHFTGGLATGYKPATVLTDLTKLVVGAKVVLAGYGASTVQQNVATGMYEHKGSGQLRAVGTTIKDMSFSVSEVVFEQSLGKGACHGDSGGPSYIKVGNTYQLFGVTSRGVDDANDTCGVSSAYTSIPFYSNWIKDTADQLNAANPHPIVVSPVSPLIAMAQ